MTFRDLLTEKAFNYTYDDGHMIVNLVVDKNVEDMDTITREDFVYGIEDDLKAKKNKGTVFLPHDGFSVRWRRK